MISHCIPAAGIAGLIKTALALHHRVLPPTLVRIGQSRARHRRDAVLRQHREPAPWIAPARQRRAAPAIDSFGFGGINVARDRRGGAGRRRSGPSAARPGRPSCACSRRRRAEALIAKLDALARGARREHGADAARRRSPRSLARADRGEPVRLAIVAKDTTSLRQAASSRRGRKLRDEAGAALVDCAAARSTAARRVDGKLAFLFPGEGSQYTGHARPTWRCASTKCSSWLDFWHTLYDQPRGDNRTDIVFPPASEIDDGAPRAARARACTTWTSAARPCSSPAWRCMRCCARSASSPT